MPGHNLQSSGHLPIPMRRLVAIFLVMTIGVASLWTLIDQVSDDGASDDPPGTSTTTADPAPGETSIAGPDGTPNAAQADLPRSGSLPDLLRYAPDRLNEGGFPLTDIAHYADISAWMNQAGVPAPPGPDDPALVTWEAQLANLAIPASLGERGLDPVWEATYGFSLLDLDQVLGVGHAPDYVFVMRGAFDAEAMQDAWVRNGYQPVEVEGTTIWSLYPEDAIDLSSPASRPSMGALNNVTLLPDGMLVTAARLSRMEFALEAIGGSGPSLAENDDVASLLETGNDAERFVSAIIARGELLRVLPSGLPQLEATPVPDAARSITDQALDRAATARELLQMPEIDLLVIGIVSADDGAAANAAAGSATGSAADVDAGTPVSASPMLFRMILSTEDIDAGRNARETITRRLVEDVSPVTGTSYLERFGTPRIVVREARRDRAAVTFDATLRRGVGDWLTIIDDRDLGFAMWIGPADDPELSAPAALGLFFLARLTEGMRMRPTRGGRSPDRRPRRVDPDRPEPPAWCRPGRPSRASCRHPGVVLAPTRARIAGPRSRRWSVPIRALREAPPPER